MRKKRWGWLNSEGSLNLPPPPHPDPLCHQPIPLFSLRTALLPATLSGIQPTAHSGDFLSPLTVTGFTFCFPATPLTQTGTERPANSPSAAPGGIRFIIEPRLSPMLPLPSSPISASQISGGHTIPWESLALSQVNSQEGKGSQTLPMWRKGTGHL